MGFALAEAAIDAGASVALIAGPVHLTTPKRCQRINVQSAQQMLEAAVDQLNQCDIFISCAAVADYRPANIAEQKIKKNNECMTINLVKNPDIITSIANHPQRPFTVGFAAETQNLIEHAQQKLTKKNLDLIIANDVSNPDIGFNSDSNAATIIGKHLKRVIPIASKQQLAREIIAVIAKRFNPQ
jgi:phosphopantothenoylcysteine decarboxylase/phosphopantothenate--cysteine ligase